MSPVFPIYTIEYFSRYGQQRIVTLLDEKRGIFSVSGKSEFTRGGEEIADFEGGGCYMVGGDFHGLGEVSSLKWLPVSDDGVDRLPTVLVSVRISPKGRRAIRKWRKEHEVGDQVDERQGGQGSSCGAPRCCGGVCRAQERRDGGEVAVGDRQEERIGNGLRNDTVEGSGGDGDGVAGSVAAQVERLKEDIVRGHERRREDIERRYPRVFGGGTRTSDPESVGTVRWECGYGWDSLIETLAERLDREVERNPSLIEGDFIFKITEIKEKFAGLRIYHDGGNGRIHGMIRMVEEMSKGVCEVCGGVGFLCRSDEGKGGWYKTICGDCLPNTGYGKVHDDSDKYEHDPREQRKEDHGQQDQSP